MIRVGDFLVQSPIYNPPFIEKSISKKVTMVQPLELCCDIVAYIVLC